MGSPLTPYYFPTKGREPDEYCTEPCRIKKGTFVGSVNCQECKHCKMVAPTEYGEMPAWIACERIDEAVGFMTHFEDQKQNDWVNAIKKSKTCDE